MMPEWLDATLGWLARNKDAAPVLAALGTILTAIVAIVAVVSGPRTQRKIARAQLTADVYGAADHQWVVDFRQAVAELYALSMKRLAMAATGQGAESERTELGHAASLLTIKILLMAPKSADSEALAKLLTDMTYHTDQAKQYEAADLVLDKARELIEQREANLSAYVAGAVHERDR